MPGKLENPTVTTGLEKINFHSIPKKDNAQDVPATIQLHSVHMLARFCSKAFKQGFSIMWTKKLLEVKVEFWRDRGTRDQIANTVGSQRKQGSLQKKFCFDDYGKSFDCVDHISTWRILKEMRIPDHLICLLRNLYLSQEAAISIRHGITDMFKIGEGVQQCSILTPCLFNLELPWWFRW